MLKISNTLIFILLFLGFIACSDNSTQTPAKVRTASEDELVGRLSGLMAMNSTEQYDIDRNLLVNYAIDSLLDVQMTPNGMFYIIDNPEEGKLAEYNSQVSIHYTGRLLNGKVFDSSHNRGEPLYINLGQVIEGWRQGVQMLKPGGKATFLIPSDLAYGTHGFSGLIPPNSCLRFEVELIAVH